MEIKVAKLLNNTSWFIFILVILFAAQDSTMAQEKESTIDKSTMLEWFEAAKLNDIASLKNLLDLKIPLDSKDSQGRTALLIATHNNAIQAANLLIKGGADVNAKDQLQDSPYLYAGAEGKLEILKMAVAAGADLNSTNRYGGTALTPAAHHGHVDVVRYLVTTKIDLDQINDLGWTALLEAVILGNGGVSHQKIVKLLLEAGADKSIADRDGKTPLDHARTSNQAEIIKLLE